MLQPQKLLYANWHNLGVLSIRSHQRDRISAQNKGSEAEKRTKFAIHECTNQGVWVHKYRIAMHKLRGLSAQYTGSNRTIEGVLELWKPRQSYLWAVRKYQTSK